MAEIFFVSHAEFSRLRKHPLQLVLFALAIFESGLNLHKLDYLLFIHALLVLLTNFLHFAQFIVDHV